MTDKAKVTKQTLPTYIIDLCDNDSQNNQGWQKYLSDEILDGAKPGDLDLFVALKVVMEFNTSSVSASAKIQSRTDTALIDHKIRNYRQLIGFKRLSHLLDKMTSEERVTFMKGITKRRTSK